MSDLVNLIRRIVAQELANHGKSMPAIVDSYDPNEHAVKVKFLTEVDANGDPKISGWLRIKTAAGGAAGSMVIGPSIGDQCMVHHSESDPEGGHASGFIHNDTDRPPVAQAGQGVLKLSSLTIQCGGVTMVVSSSGVAITGGTMTHNGHDVGSDHQHTNVQPGSGLSGAPQ